VMHLVNIPTLGPVGSPFCRGDGVESHQHTLSTAAHVCLQLQMGCFEKVGCT
jgi:hypothetical protein